MARFLPQVESLETLVERLKDEFPPLEEGTATALRLERKAIEDKLAAIRETEKELSYRLRGVNSYLQSINLHQKMEEDALREGARRLSRAEALEATRRAENADREREARRARVEEANERKAPVSKKDSVERKNLETQLSFLKLINAIDKERHDKALLMDDKDLATYIRRVGDSTAMKATVKS